MPTLDLTRKRLSRLMFEAVMLSDCKQYVLAKRIGIHPSLLNKAIHGGTVDASDVRWKKLARLVRVSEDKLYSD